MSNNHKNGRNKWDFKSLWKRGEIQKRSRITFDVVWNVILFFIIIGVIGLFFAGGVGAGYFASLVKDEDVRSKAEMQDSIYNYAQTSVMLFQDNSSEIGDVSSDIYREEIQLDQVSEHLKHAVIATEDENFNVHKGVVPKAVMRAIVQEVTNSSVKTGGSTLTQQLVKNQILTNEVSFERKAKEILLALRVERFFDKDEILEAYLNIVSFGRNANGQNVAGVQTAAQGIFGVDASELSIAQSAFIAGLPQSPFGYTPFNNDGSLKSKEELEPGMDRMREVLERMYEADYITKAEYDKAKQFEINKENLAKPTPSAYSKYPALTQEVQKRAKRILRKQLMEENDHTEKDLAEDEALAEEYRTLAERRLTSGGYKIHTTIDKGVYEAVQEVRNSYTHSDRYWPTQVSDIKKDSDGNPITLPLQMGSMIIENTSGKILGFIGGSDFEKEKLNHATTARRSIGSTMKPLLVYGPSIDLGAAQPGSVIADVPYRYPASQGGGELNNYSENYHGLVSARYALAKSYNIPAVKQYSKIVNKDPVKNYLEKMGVEKLQSGDHINYSMALGSFVGHGMTVEENTNAYATFANSGNFVDAYMIDKIETKDGEVIYEHETEKTKVYSPQAAYLTIDMMRDVLKYGTGSGIRRQLTNPGVDWAGKSGTSQKRRDSWFVATNPNVTVSMWTGFGEEQDIGRGYSSRTQAIWADVVNAASKVKPEVMVPSNSFNRPDGIVSRSYCATSGLLASDLCASVGLAKSDIYNAKYVPSKVDDSLISGDFVKVKDQLVVAGPNTPGEFIMDQGGVTLSPEFLEENDYTSPEVLRELLPSSGAWSNVALPSSSSIGSTKSSIDNDGQAPSAPGGVSASGSKIDWSPSASNDVVGYRVYKASVPGGSFSLVGSTVNTSLSFSGGEGIYAVRAVDYFGASSGLSATATVGNPGAPEPEPEPEPEQDQENNNGSNNDNSGSSNGGSNDNGSSNGGAGDAGSGDGGSNDDGSGNAGSGNSGSDDGGSGDAGSGNGGPDDGGSSDAGSGNGGSDDGGSGDAGSGNGGSDDGGSSDAGSGNGGS
ncbi:transglycosylase domain-containing protein, partial [Halobacillus sp. BBL2006]|uniref:transglycosylase domain-containing protein n=1 Tax=Halobacillus sp. BBL2006 TaxID=1543706 RepID=UPI0009DFFEC6